MLKAQDSTRHISIGIDPMYGVFLPHHPEIEYLVGGHIASLELEVAFATDGSEPWHHAFNFPSWGFDANVYDLSSPYLGKSAATRIFYDLPITRSRSIGLKMGIGIGYIEKPFDKDNNFHNSAIGSTLNAALALNVYGKIPLSRKWVLKPGIAIHHMSNGAIKMPNSGINLALLNLMISYDPKGFETPTRREIPFTPKPGYLMLGASYGAKEIYPIGGQLYNVVNIFGMYQKRVSPKSSIGGELGLNYNASLSHRVDEEGETAGEAADNYRAFIAGLYQLHFDPFGIRFEAGSYIAPNYKGDGLIFFRYHLLYNLDPIQVFFGLKSHFAKADNFELGLGYIIK